MQRTTLNYIQNNSLCHKLDMNTFGKVRVSKSWQRQIDWIASAKDKVEFIYIIEGDGYVTAYPADRIDRVLGLDDDNEETEKLDILKLGVFTAPGKWTSDNLLAIPDSILFHLFPHLQFPLRFWTVTLKDRFVLMNETRMQAERTRHIHTILSPTFDN